MIRENTLEKYLNYLLSGDRNGCRSIIEETLQSGIPANRVYMDVIWPVMIELEKLHRSETISCAQEALASRINRTIVDQLQNKLPRKANRGKKIVIFSSPEEHAELGAQMTADLFESDGWQVRFLGGSVDNDEILSFVHEFRPDVLLLYGIRSKDAPSVRQLIDTTKTIHAFPDMRIMLSAGIFGRADGLWEEIGADMYADNATEAVQKADSEQSQLPRPEKTIKKRRKTCTVETPVLQVQLVES